MNFWHFLYIALLSLLVSACGRSWIWIERTPSIAAPSNVSVKVTDSEVEEGGLLRFPVSLSNASSNTVEVKYETVGVSALEDVHYSSVSGSLTFAPGETTKYIEVQTSVSAIFCESTRHVRMELSDAINATIEDAHGVGRIKDSSRPQLTFSNAPRVEGQPAVIVATLSNVCASFDVEFEFLTADETATSPDRYVAQAMTGVVIPKGTVEKRISIDTIDDDTYRGNQTFRFTASNLQNASFAGANDFSVTILDSEAIPAVQFAEAGSQQPEDDGAKDIVVEIPYPSAFNISVDVAIEPLSTASFPGDYALSASTITIPAGSTSAVLTITPVLDATVEPDESVILSLGNPVNATLGAIATHTFLIMNDDFGTVNWTGATSNDFSVASNWSPAVVPGPSERAVFSSVCAGNCSPTLSAPISVGGLQIQSGITFTQGTHAINVGILGFNQNGGVFVGGSGDIGVNGRVSISVLNATDFRSTSGKLLVRPASSAQAAFYFNRSGGGQFNHNGGTIEFRGNASGNPTYGIEIGTPTSLQVNNLIFSSEAGGASDVAKWTMGAGDAFVALGDFSIGRHSGSGGVAINRAAGSASMSVRGNIFVTAGSAGGAMPLRSEGNANSTYRFSGGGHLTRFVFAKGAGGELADGGSTSDPSFENLMMGGSTLAYFRFPSGSRKIVLKPSMNGILTSTFDYANTSVRLSYEGTLDLAGNIKAVWNCSLGVLTDLDFGSVPSFALNDLEIEFVGSNCLGGTTRFGFGAAKAVTFTGNVSIKSAHASHQAAFREVDYDFTFKRNFEFSTSYAALSPHLFDAIFDGVGEQRISLPRSIYAFPSNVLVSKPSGSLYFDSGLYGGNGSIRFAAGESFLNGNSVAFSSSEISAPAEVSMGCTNLSAAGPKDPTRMYDQIGSFALDSTGVPLVGLERYTKFVRAGQDSRSNVLHIRRQSDGKYLLGGSFDAIAGTASSRNLVRLTSAGAYDASYNVGTSTASSITQLELLGNDKAIVRTPSSTFNGQTVPNALRLNVDGSIDTTFSFPFIPTAFAVLTKVPSRFEQVFTYRQTLLESGGECCSDIWGLYPQRLSPVDAAPASGMSGELRTPGGGSVAKIFEDSLGRVVVAGYFDSYDNERRNGMVRTSADGVLDTTFRLPSDVFSINSISQQSSGKLVVAGLFESIGGLPIKYIARLNDDGSLDASFNIGNGFDGSVSKVHVLPDDKILVSGNFKTVNGVPRMRIARLNADGSLDTTFVPPTEFATPIRDFDVDPSGNVAFARSCSF